MPKLQESYLTESEWITLRKRFDTLKEYWFTLQEEAGGVPRRKQV